tara:strand:+ start:179 stop:520 length:342 start_codon:yes stop_codon:yes gene_type:complete
MRAVKKIKGILFNIHEAVWWVVAEIEDWLYPYHDRLTPEDKFEIRVKDPYTGEQFMVEEHIQGLTEKINKLQDQMMDVQQQLNRHEEQLKFKVKKIKESPSVSGAVKKMKVPD